MGHLNLMLEEADAMERNGVRSFVLLSLLIVFSLLLSAGGERLIGHADGYGPDAMDSAIPLYAVITQAPQRIDETCMSENAVPRVLRREAASIMRDTPVPICVISDANGNVLRASSYLHTVYQLFSLGDGFV